MAAHEEPEARLSPGSNARGGLLLLDPEGVTEGKPRVEGPWVGCFFAFNPEGVAE